MMAPLKTLVGFLCVAWVVIGQVSSKSIKKRLAPSNKHEQLRNLYNCRHVRNKADCQFLLGNVLSVKSHRISRRTPQDQTSHFAETDNSKCPSYEGNYLLQDNLPDGLRSLSPYEITVDHNPNRIPKDIPQARCLCKGCISPETLKETKTMFSVPLTTTIDVYKRNTANILVRSKETVTVGCTCIFPITFSG